MAEWAGFLMFVWGWSLWYAYTLGKIHGRTSELRAANQELRASRAVRHP